VCEYEKNQHTFTASKLMSESTATVAALLSALLASRRKRVLRANGQITAKSSDKSSSNLHDVVRTVNHV
jgi:hypothetical protein